MNNLKKYSVASNLLLALILHVVSIDISSGEAFVRSIYRRAPTTFTVKQATQNVAVKIRIPQGKLVY